MYSDSRLYSTFAFRHRNSRPMAPLSRQRVHRDMRTCPQWSGVRASGGALCVLLSSLSDGNLEAVVGCASERPAHHAAAAALGAPRLSGRHVAAVDDAQALAAEHKVSEAAEAARHQAARAQILVHLEPQVALRGAVADVDPLEDAREVLPPTASTFILGAQLGSGGNFFWSRGKF